MSTERIVQFRVPRGRVLGPLPFNINTNDLPKSIDHPITLLADDSIITIAHRYRNRDSAYESEINNAIE